MSSLDITFCSNLNCSKIECMRNQRGKEFTIPYISVSDFKDCEHFKEVADDNINRV